VSQKQGISAGEMYRKPRVKWASDHLGLRSTQIDPLLTKICAKNDFYIFVLCDLDLWPLDFNFTLLVTLVQGHASNKPLMRSWDHLSYGITECYLPPDRN